MSPDDGLPIETTDYTAEQLYCYWVEIGDDVEQATARGDLRVLQMIRQVIEGTPGTYLRDVMVRDSFGVEHTIDMHPMPIRRTVGIGAMENPWWGSTFTARIEFHARQWAFRGVDPRHVSRLEGANIIEMDEDGMPRLRHPTIRLFTNDWRHYRR